MPWHSGVCDFHSLRRVYISNLVASGASVKVCQVLARHSTPSLTIGVYAKESVHDIRGAVEVLPDPGAVRPAPKAEAATGTAGRRIKDRLAPPLPHEGDGSGRNPSVVGGNEHRNQRSHALPFAGRNPLENRAVVATSRPLSAPVNECRRWESNPHGGYPPEDFKSSASAVSPRRPSEIDRETLTTHAIQSEGGVRGFGLRSRPQPLTFRPDIQKLFNKWVVDRAGSG